MNNFDNLARLALNEASFGAYMQVAKDAARSTAKAATSPLSITKGVLKAADFFASKSGMQYGGQFGTLANRVQSLQDLGASAQEELILKKLYGENPKKGDKIDVELPGIKSPNAYIKNVESGAKGESIYTIELFPIIGNLAADTSTVLGGGGNRLQRQQLDVKKKSPIDQLSFTKGNRDYGSTNVRLSLYKNGKLVAARNIPGLRDSGGLHFNGTGRPWTLNLDTSDSIDFADITSLVATNKTLGLTPEQMKQVVSAKNYPQLKQILTKLGKGELYIKAYTDAVTALRQGQAVPSIPQSKNKGQQKSKQQKKTKSQKKVKTNKQPPRSASVAKKTTQTKQPKKFNKRATKSSLKYNTAAPSPHTNTAAGSYGGKMYPPPSGVKL